ncbi:hypothetical protein C8F04DRAFT_1182417 [Mycena alexandri]|uniref:Uncharacterized protein n=1 Tax=Mycena alexandri TaxID=1745969 RepID=A0AAD6SWR2_9AGAR|nr:hypothetical protein C8F04DRAFT_1182417 [Mycena alexandri]
MGTFRCSQKLPSTTPRWSQGITQFKGEHKRGTKSSVYSHGKCAKKKKKNTEDSGRLYISSGVHLPEPGAVDEKMREMRRVTKEKMEIIRKYLNEGTRKGRAGEGTIGYRQSTRAIATPSALPKIEMPGDNSCRIDPNKLRCKHHQCQNLHQHGGVRGRRKNRDKRRGTKINPSAYSSKRSVPNILGNKLDKDQDQPKGYGGDRRCAT